MAFFDSFNNPLYAPVESGMGGLNNLFKGMNIFGARQPEYLGGLLSPEELQKVQNQSLLQGVLGSAATYLAQPKNQGYGSALPYLGKAYLGGMQSSQGAYDQATQNLLTKGKLEEFKREAEAAKLTREAQQELLNDPRVQANPTLKALASKGDFSKVADVINPKPAENDYDRYSFAYKDKPFKDLTGPEKQEIIKQVQTDKQASANQFNLGSPVAGVDPQTGQPVFFQASKAGGKPEIVPGIVPKSGEAQTKQIGGIDSLNSAIQSYKEKLKTWSPTDAADPNKRAQMKTVYNNMMLQAKEAYGLGVLNGPDYTILTDTIADPTTAKGVAYGAFGALEGQADTLSELMQRTKESLQGGKGIKPKENVPPSNAPKIIKFDSKGQRIN
jgi:hypothetical protein